MWLSTLDISAAHLCSVTEIAPKSPFLCSLLLRRFVFRMAEASAKRVTGDEPQGTMGRVQTASEARLARCLLPAFLCAHIFIKRETSGYEADSYVWTEAISGIVFAHAQKQSGIECVYNKIWNGKLILTASILGDPGAVSRVDKIFLVKVFCNIETSSSRSYGKLSSRIFYRPD